MTPARAPVPLLDSETLRQLERLRMSHLDALIGGVTGERAARERRPGIEFDDYRAYVPGDDLRSIDWNVYGRLGEPFVKVAPSEGRVSLALLVDVSRSMASGSGVKLDHARRLAAALGAVALLAADSVSVWALADGRAEPGPVLVGRRALPALVDRLERLEAGTGTDLPASVAAFAPAGADVAVLVSDLAVDPAQEAALDDLAAAVRVGAVAHVVDPEEARPQLTGAVELQDAETGRRVPLDVTRAVRERYAQLFAERTEGLRARCARSGVAYLPAPVDVTPVELLASRAAGGLLRG